jgi:hypothetical protein
MAQLPDLKTLEDAVIQIFQEFSNSRAHSGDCLMVHNFTQPWFQLGFRADELDTALNSLVDKGVLVVNQNNFYCLTDRAVELRLITHSTLEEIERAIFKFFADRHLRAGDCEMIHLLGVALTHQGFRVNEVNNAIHSLVEKHFFAINNEIFLCLTEQGFNEM